MMKYKPSLSKVLAERCSIAHQATEVMQHPTQQSLLMLMSFCYGMSRAGAI